MPRNKRTIRCKCELGNVECRKTENTLYWPRYFVDPSSVADYIEQQRSLLGAANISGNPACTPSFGLGAGSAGIDTGTTTLTHNGETVLTIPPTDCAGTATDLARCESGKLNFLSGVVPAHPKMFTSPKTNRGAAAPVPVVSC